MNRQKSMLQILSLLGVLSISACGDSDTGSVSGIGDLDQLAQVVARSEDRVSADELAQWIIEGRKDFVLIDVRPRDEYDRGYIEGAYHLTVPELVTPEQLKTLPKDRKIIVYSQGSETAAQAAVLLRLAGFDGNLLLGGYNFWSRHVLNPSIPPVDANGEFPRVPEQQPIACYFVGGNKLAQAPAAPPKQNLPAFVPPVSTPATLPPATDEGC